MDINQLTIGQAKELAAMFGAQQSIQAALDAHLIGKHVIIRTYSAGVHFGILDARQGAEVRLTDTRRIWYWNKAFTLSKVAADGIDQSTSKLSVTIPEIVLTEAIEIIPVSAPVALNIATAAAHCPE
jgi:hypothetical protein